MLAAERKRDPENLIPEFLANYIDFFQLFFNEDAAEYPAIKVRIGQRLDRMSEGPDASPFFLFTRSVIQFQWAAIKVKMGSNLDAGLGVPAVVPGKPGMQAKIPGFRPRADVKRSDEGGSEHYTRRL